MKFFPIVLIMLFLTSCASYNPGEYAHVKKGKHPKNVPINAEYYRDYSNFPLHFVNVTFGNQSEDWRRVKSVKVTNVGGIAKSRIIVGPDLVYWSKGITRKLKIDSHNNRMILGAIMGAFAVGAGVSANNGNYDLGIGLAAGALATATVADINSIFERIDSLEIAKLVPPDHLYSPFSIPPNLYITKWVVFQTPGGELPKFIDFEVKYLSGETASYRTKLRL